MAIVSLGSSSVKLGSSGFKIVDKGTKDIKTAIGRLANDLVVSSRGGSWELLCDSVVSGCKDGKSRGVSLLSDNSSDNILVAIIHSRWCRSSCRILR